MLDLEHEAMKREAEQESKLESDCWRPNGEPCLKCRFNGDCLIQKIKRVKGKFKE